MTPTRSGSNYCILSNGSGPGHSSNKSKTQEFHPRGETQIEYARTSTSSQRLAVTFDTLIESNNRDIPVSVQDPIHGRKAEGVETPAKSLDRPNELLSSSEEAHGPRKDRRISEGLDTHVLQGPSPTDKSLVEKPKHVIRGPEEVGPRKGQQPSGSSPSLNKCQKRIRKFQRSIRRTIKS
ncbi:hypothetical protein O181_066160 [Austropuccinia psidii MF-1]|uniref:Uncharacterized protein n=1 Tax=Austropuccinia psidii MF-1 TaxID=1389203 RepID=A0A9Q3EWI8_9BASI|nr:hypothetical protein [Austropuccinia psidii MF-1]